MIIFMATMNVVPSNYYLYAVISFLLRPTVYCKCCQSLHENATLPLVTIIFTGGIARSASRRYLIYLEADFEVFRPTGATRCTDGVEIWRGGPPSPHPRQISPPLAQRQGCRTPKLKFLLRFDQNVEYKRPTGAFPLHDFHKICRVCTSFQDALGVKISLDSVKGLWSYGGFKFRESGYPIFSAPPSGESMRQTPKVLEVQERARGPLSSCQVWWGSDFTRRRGSQKR